MFEKIAQPILAITCFCILMQDSAFAGYPSFLDGETPKDYVCCRASSLMNIDGRLDESSWADASWTDPFQDIEGDKKPAPRYATRAKMLWDDEYFYIAAYLEEPHVWGTLTERDCVIFNDNDFEVFIDPNGDNHEYYEFEMNALNTVWDLFLPKPYKDGVEPQNDWNIAGLKTGVHIDGTINDPSDEDKGWSLEIAFPWKALAQYAHCPAPPQNGDYWRIDFSRVEWQIRIEDGKYRKVPRTKEDNWIWSPPGVIDMHRPERWGYVQFSTAKPGVDSFQPDAAYGAKIYLHKIYYAQREFQKQNQRWANNLEELQLNQIALPPGTSAPRIESTTDGYTASLELTLPGGAVKKWNIRQDSLLWKD
ncbi:MAG: carbohydrate-binding family 9-like protein [Candidatus Omnitrophota bacterium]